MKIPTANSLTLMRFLRSHHLWRSQLRKMGRVLSLFRRPLEQKLFFGNPLSRNRKRRSGHVSRIGDVGGEIATVRARWPQSSLRLAF